MNKITLATYSFAAVASIVSTTSLANDSKLEVSDSPLFGAIEVRTTSFEDEDINTEVVRASIGAKGMYKYENFKAVYHLDVDFAPAANSQLNSSISPSSPFDSDDDIWVRTAVIALPTKYGTAVIGQGPSGNYLDVYRVLDLFKTNSWEPYSQNPNMLFDQGGYGFNVLSYATPKFANGTLQAKVTNLSLIDTNDEDSDALGYRLLFTKNNLYVALSRVDIDRMVPTDYHRNTLAMSYKIDNFYVAGLYELVENNPTTGDQNNWGVAISYKINDTKLSIGHTRRNANLDSADDDLLVAGVKYQGFENLELWAEAASTDSDGNDNLSAGIALYY